MPYLAALAAAGALFFYLRGPAAPAVATHAQPRAFGSQSGDLGDNPDFTGQDLARLYLDELEGLHSHFGGPVGGYSPAPGVGGSPGDANAGVTAAGVPVTSSGGPLLGSTTLSSFAAAGIPGNLPGSGTISYGGGGGAQFPALVTQAFGPQLPAQPHPTPGATTAGVA